MNEITTYEGKVSLAEIRADSRRFPRLKSYHPEQALRMMSLVVTRAFNWRGKKAEKDDINIIATSLYTELMADNENRRTYNLTFEEIEMAIKKAVLGQSIEMYGEMSFASLYKAVMHYVNHDGLQANEQMLRQSESGRIALVKNATKLITSAPARKMLENKSNEL